MRCLLTIVLALCSLLSVGLDRAQAQEATPAAGMGEAVDPAECRVEPRPTDELLALWYGDVVGTPVVAVVDESWTPEPPPPPAAFPELPLGEPADVATVTAVIDTVRQDFACNNAGEYWRALALYTDDLARQYAPIFIGEPPADLRAFVEASPEPEPFPGRLRLLAVTDVAVMADGRVGAIVVSDDPAVPPEGAQTALYLFLEEKGRWRIDEIVPLTAVSEGNGGTPSP
jgi:hypothetical protein